MIIQVNENWRIASDAYQWIAQRRRTVKGRPKWEGVSFHRTFDSVVLWLAQRQLRDLEGDYRLDELSSFCQALDRLSDEIRAALEGVGL